MALPDIRPQIVAALASFGNRPLGTAALNLLSTLGYSSEKRPALRDNTAGTFCEEFRRDLPFREDNALLAEWQSVELLFQLSDSEIGNYLAFSSNKLDNAIVESYVFVAVRLSGKSYTRTRLATATREINKLFPMPVMVLFHYGDTLSLSVIDRELHKFDPSKDVLRKVTLIKDIRCSEPTRAQVDILAELSLPALHEAFKFRNFVELHRAWRKKLDSSELNKQFYRDIANWYFWARKHPGVRLPKDVDPDNDEARSIFFIRLLTRLIFCWFLQEKGLIPPQLFRWNQISALLETSGPEAGTYYQAILQNLFFATLNREREKRGFRLKSKGFYDKGRGVTTFYRYEDLISDSAALLKLFAEVPFVNGGLFDCLDTLFRKEENRPNVRLDGFSDNPRESAHLPNELFFGSDQPANLSTEYKDPRKNDIRVHPLIETLARYKFTVEENTPFEEEIALDPELLGKVFENLLASYNDETSARARNTFGAFYTPRDVVHYMVDEALVANFQAAVPEAKIRHLLSGEVGNPCDDQETDRLITAIEKTRILDPACGSGAFPMGALHRLVHLLGKLDPQNIRWKRRQLDAATRDREKADSMEERQDRSVALANIEARIRDIEASFDEGHHELDYARKLYLIENSIFGVDIQPIACQIAKLRFFISLLVEQKSEKNLRPLPNLETRIVAADTLIPASKAEKRGDQFAFEGADVQALRDRLRRVRHDHFNAQTPEQKQTFRARDAAIRLELCHVLQNQMALASAERLAGWDPYDQNSHAGFFDPQWMFSLNEDFSGFDIVIGNPPYVRQEKIKERKLALKPLYQCFSGTADLFVYFYERGLQLLRPDGIFSFITSNKWLRSGYGGPLRTYLSRETQVLRLIDFGDAPIFSDAIAYSCIAILTKSSARSNTAFAAMNWNSEWDLNDIARHLAVDTFPMLQSDLAPSAWRLEGRTKLALLERIEAVGVPLGDHVKGRFYRGVLTGLNEAFVVSREKRDELIAQHPSSERVLKPFLRGRDIKRWKVDFAEQYLIRIESSENVSHSWSGQSVVRAEQKFASELPAIYEFMNPLRKELIARSDQGHYFWELRSCAYWDKFEQPKIIVPAITDTVNFASDSLGYVSNDKTSIMVPTSVPFTLAILNSQVVLWLARQTFASKQGGFFEFKPMYVSELPIPTGTPIQRNIIECIAEYIIQLKGQGPQAAFFERLLNGLVYELFFEKELHAQGLKIFDHLAAAKPPKLTPTTDLSEVHEKISDIGHPIYADLFSLNGIEVVQIIEERT